MVDSKPVSSRRERLSSVSEIGVSSLSRTLATFSSSLTSPWTSPLTSALTIAFITRSGEQEGAGLMSSRALGLNLGLASALGICRSRGTLLDDVTTIVPVFAVPPSRCVADEGGQPVGVEEGVVEGMKGLGKAAEASAPLKPT